jgi:hypothetical protein
MKRILGPVIVFGCLALVLLACSLPAAVETTASGGGLTTRTPAPLKEEEQMVPTASVSPGLQPLVDQALEDLAARLGIDAQEIQVVEAKAVVWPDASMGCPQPGMSYKQVPRDGSLIRLAAGGRVYAYHGGGTRAPFLCEQTLQPPKVTPPKLDDSARPPGSGNE